jgi:hypothetical protein
MKPIQMVVPDGGGPPTVYPQKDTMPFAIKLTTEGRKEFDRLRDVTGLSGSDLVEVLLRRFGKRVEEIRLLPAHTTRVHRRKKAN